MNSKMQNVPSSSYTASLPLSNEPKHACLRENVTEDFAVKVISMKYLVFTRTKCFYSLVY